MNTIGTTQSASNAVIAPAKSSRTEIAGNFDQFLSLLTTQLRNQDPTAPLDTNQFTQQLVQFAQVEQQLKQNETLTSLLGMSKSTTNANAMSFVGARVTTDGSTSRLQDGIAEWRVTASKGGTAAVTIKDASGNVVRTSTQTISAGTQSFAWDGRTSAGALAPAGNYSIVVDALDSQRNPFPVSTEVTGVVDSVDFSGDTPVLNIGNIQTPIDKVKSVTRT